MGEQWVSAWASTSTVRVALSCYALEAWWELSRAVHEGHIEARRWDGSPLSDDGWHRNFEDKSIIVHADLSRGEISRTDLARWLKGQEVQTGRKRGPKDQYDWPGMEAYLVANVLEWGVPMAKETLIKEAENWFKREKPANERPKRTQLRDRVSQIYDAHIEEYEKSGDGI